MTFTGKPVLVLDFDGVLHSYTSRWAGAHVVSDPPVEGAREFLLAALEKFKVSVVSSRSHERGGVEAMATWCCVYFGCQVLYHRDQVTGVFFGDLDEGLVADFPKHKPPAFLTIDDRAVTFTGAWPDVQELLKFKPWNK